MGRHLFYLSILYARWRPLYSTSRVLITHGVHRECVECINSGKFDYCSALWCIKNCCTIMWDIRRILLYKRAAMHQSAENINLLAFLCCCLYFYFFLIVHIFGNQCFVFQNIIYLYVYSFMKYSLWGQGGIVTELILSAEIHFFRFLLFSMVCFCATSHVA